MYHGDQIVLVTALSWSAPTVAGPGGPGVRFAV